MGRGESTGEGERERGEWGKTARHGDALRRVSLAQDRRKRGGKSGIEVSTYLGKTFNQRHPGYYKSDVMKRRGRKGRGGRLSSG